MDRASGTRRDSLSPTPLDRLAALARPSRAHTTMARRVAAAVLTAVAVALLLRGHPTGDRVQVVAAARDLSPGTVLRPDDLRLTPLSADTVPAGALRRIDEAT